jgi:uncharacterized protein with HEPN domain
VNRDPAACLGDMLDYARDVEAFVGPSAFPVQVSTSFSDLQEFGSKIIGPHIATERPSAPVRPYAPGMRKNPFVAGMDAEVFAKDRKTQYAVLRALEVIGEAAKRVPPDTQARFPDTPWRQIIGMRNIIAHDYLGNPDKGFSGD